jgi:hypothetical protein
MDGSANTDDIAFIMQFVLAIFLPVLAIAFIGAAIGEIRQLPSKSRDKLPRRDGGGIPPLG